jgi:hypothetical protein
MLLNRMEHDLLYALLNRLADLELLSEDVCRAAQAAVASRAELPKLLEGLPPLSREVFCHGSAQHSG